MMTHGTILIEAEGDTAAVCLSLLVHNFRLDPSKIVVSTSHSFLNHNLILTAKSLGCPLFLVGYTENFLDYILTRDLNFIISLFGRRYIPVDKLGVPISQTINFHPSLLPSLGGCFSVPWAIIKNFQQTGITFHNISSVFDKGPIVYQEPVAIYPSDDSSTLYSRIRSLLLLRFNGIFREFFQGQLLPTGTISQTEASYYPRSLPYSGFIQPDWDINMVERFIRAMRYAPHPPAKLNTSSGIRLITSIDEYFMFLDKSSWD